MSAANDRLFSPAFFVMCGFTFTVFLSAFQLLPTAPFHILDLGGTTFASGLFLGFLTYSSAFSAPLTGAIADRVGQRRVLLTSSIALAVFSIAYAFIPSVPVLLALVLIHGVFWSGLLSASAAYMTNMLPERRRAEGIGYWGLSSVGAMAVAPTAGFWIYRHGWVWLCVGSAALNLIMAGIAWHLRGEGERTPNDSAASRPSPSGVARAHCLHHALPLLIRLRRHHELHSALRGRERRDAEEHLSDHSGDRHSADASDGGPAGRQFGYRAYFSAVPRADQRWPGVPGGRRHAWLDDRVGSIFGAGSAPPIRSTSATSCAAWRRTARRGLRGDPGRIRHGIGTGSTRMGWIIQHSGSRPPSAWRPRCRRSPSRIS